MFDYKGKTALITGASSGIGESFARELAARGMNVVLVARSEAKLRLLAQELSQRHHVRAEAIAVDLSQEGATRIIQAAMQQFDLEIDLLINDATEGESVNVPINAPHGCTNRSDRPTRFLSTSTYYHEAVFNEVGVLVRLEDEINPLTPEAVQRFETVAAKYQGFTVEAIDSGRLLDGE